MTGVIAFLDPFFRTDLWSYIILFATITLVKIFGIPYILYVVSLRTVTERRILEHTIAFQKRMQYSRAAHWIYPTGCMTKCKITRLLEQTCPLLTSEIALHVMSRRWCNSLAFSYFTCGAGKAKSVLLLNLLGRHIFVKKSYMHSRPVHRGLLHR